MMAADYRHIGGVEIGGVENRLGRHDSRFSPFSPAPALADQSLAQRKSWNAGSNRRSQASGGRAVGGRYPTAWARLRRKRPFRRTQSNSEFDSTVSFAASVHRRW